MMTALQVGLGIYGFHRARGLRRSNLLRLGIPNSAGRRLAKWACIFGGSYLIFTAGLEMTRLVLPYDPWSEEAQIYRRLAVKQGDKPSWWFGAYHYYTPMPYSEWTQRTELWLVNAHNYQHSMGEARVAGGSHRGRSPALQKLAEKGRYSEIYAKIRNSNHERFEKLLAEDLKDVSEINKGARIDLILEGKGPVHYCESYSKAQIELGNHQLDTDDDLEMVWMNFEPWEELRHETDYDIRLVPRWKWKNDDEGDEGELLQEAGVKEE